MEEECQQVAPTVESNQPADDGGNQANGAGARDVQGPETSKKKESSKRKKPWRDGYVTPKLGKNKPTEPVSRRDEGEPSAGPSGLASPGQDEAHGEARASSSSSSSSSSEPEEDSDKSLGDSSDDDSSDDEPVEPPVKKRRVSKSKSTYSRFDPGQGDVTHFELPTADMVEYVTKLFTQYIPDKKIRETITNEYPIAHGVPGLTVPVIDEYIPEKISGRQLTRT